MRKLLFALALALGYPHPDYLIPYLTSQQITDWLGYFRLQPFGEERADWRMGQLAALFANAFKEDSTPPFSPEDFYANQPMPEPDPKQVAQKTQRLLDRFR